MTGETRETASPPTPPPDTPSRWDIVAFASVAQTVSVLGEHVFLTTALPLWAYSLTRSASGVSLVLAALDIAALFSVGAGAWVRGRLPRAVLLGCSAARTALTLLAALLLWLLPLPGLAALPPLARVALVALPVFGVSLMDSFFMPTLKAGATQWVNPRHWLRLNAIIEATDIPAYLVGPLLGIWLYERGGAAGAALALALAYAAGWLLLAMRLPRTAPPARDNTIPLLWTACPPPLRRPLVGWVLATAVLGTIQVLVLPFIETELGLPDSAWGVFGALVGVGVTLGAVAGGLLEERVSPALLLVASAGVVGASLLVFASTHSAWGCGAMWLVGGAGFAGLHIGTTTLVQQKSPPAQHTTLLGLTHSVEAAGSLVGLVAAPALSATFGLRPALGGAAIVMLGATLLFLPRLTRPKEY